MTLLTPGAAGPAALPDLDSCVFPFPSAVRGSDNLDSDNLDNNNCTNCSNNGTNCPNPLHAQPSPPNPENSHPHYDQIPPTRNGQLDILTRTQSASTPFSTSTTTSTAVPAIVTQTLTPSPSPSLPPSRSPSLSPSPSPSLPPLGPLTASATLATPAATPASAASHTSLTLHSFPAIGIPSPAPSSSSASTSTTTTPLHVSQARKPSPGLAARLKALGFGSRPSSSSSNSSAHQPPDNIGRLPEDQLRELDYRHQAGSVVPVIERRGRPWKGAGAVVRRLPSVASLKGSLRKGLDTDSTTPNTTNTANTHEDDAASIVLPEIEPASPLEMDTHKYRLPDHINGNGTKVQLDTRQQHLDRDPAAAYAATASSSSSLAHVHMEPTDPPPMPSIEPTNPMEPMSPTPPPPPPKDTPPLQQMPMPMHTPSQTHHKRISSTSSFYGQAPSTPQQTEFNADAIYFNPLGLQRAGSIYTLSRVSFANQLAQLTSLQLPDAESLSSRVSAIPTAQAASRALIGAAEQIRLWIAKASEVIDGLDSDDDVEWAAAGGREGLEEVENAILRFEELINVYVSAIEELQCRPDIASVSPEELTRAVVQMESILDEWRKMRNALQTVKAQVEIAMEWEELWSMVLGDIQNEMEELSRLVFEMEERRHKSIMAGGSSGEAAGVDIGDLETIVEETQHQQQQQPPNSAATRVPSSGNKRYSIPIFPASPTSPDAGTASTPHSISQISQDDSSLLALFARMQPLRASLDFLPMRLSVFETRASSCFPTACEELEMRRCGLDGSYKKLEKDAESLRKELGEDRWIAVFRGAARQAQKMYESVERSVAKLREALDAGLHLTNQPLMAKKTESYETKKMHYGPAIERVLAIIDKGIKDRLTLNGEILRLHAELQTKWDDLRDRMHDVDLFLEDVQSDCASLQLRDSVSSMLSNDRSTLGSGHETPQSSPPSSVILSSLGFDSSSQRAHAATTKADKAAAASSTPNNASHHAANGTGSGNRRRSVMGSSFLPQPATRRTVSSSAAAVAQARKPLRFSMSASPGSGVSASGAFFSSISTPSREGSLTPVGQRSAGNKAKPTPPSDHRPRWNSSTNGIDTGHNFKPLTLTTPSPYAKTPPPPMRRLASSTASTPGSAQSKLPMRSPLSRASSSPSAAGIEAAVRSPSRSPSAMGANMTGVPNVPYRPRLNSNAQSTSRPRLSFSSSVNAVAANATALAANRRVSMQPARLDAALDIAAAQRPASSLATSRRSSLMPGMRPKREGSVSGLVSGRSSVQGMRKNSINEKAPDRPRWRH